MSKKNAFWGGMELGFEVAVMGMGEKVMVREREVDAIVPSGEEDPRVGGGGTDSGLVLEFYVGLKEGAEIRDGDDVEARGMRGVVLKREHLGVCWLIRAGEPTRWDGSGLD
jgi:hypothetical protein